MEAAESGRSMRQEEGDGREVPQWMEWVLLGLAAGVGIGLVMMTVMMMGGLG